MSMYRVFRRGFNAANNSSMGARPEDCVNQVATVEAESAEQAVQAALDQGVTVYNGQGIWAELESDCLAEEAKQAEEHAGKVLVKYWRGTLALEDWCSTPEEIEHCLSLHSNSYSPCFYTAEQTEIDYEQAILLVGGDPYAENEEDEEVEEIAPGIYETKDGDVVRGAE